MLTAAVAKSLTTTALLNPVSCANTAAATTTSLDVAGYEGTLTFLENVGTITGTLAGKIVTSDSSDLSGSSDVATFTSRTTSNDNATFALEIECSALKRYVGYVGTIVTGPALICVTASGTLKYV